MHSAYLIVRGSMYLVEEEVNKYLDAGYKPLGGLVESGQKNHFGDNILAQAIYREEK